MKLVPIATLSFVLLIAACSEDPNTQSQSQSESSSANAVTESSDPAPTLEESAPAPAELAATEKPAEQTVTPDKPSQSDALAQVAEATTPAPTTQEAAQAAKPGLVAGASKLELGEAIGQSEDIFAEKCEVDPATGRVVCSSGLCGLFNDICPPGTPQGLVKIPFEIGYNIATSFASGALNVAKAGLETTDTGTKLVEKANDVVTRAKKAINYVINKIRLASNGDTKDKAGVYNAQVMNGSKPSNQAAN
jgi:hypothetical protein